jgi:hypothetical protein
VVKGAGGRAHGSVGERRCEVCRRRVGAVGHVRGGTRGRSERVGGGGRGGSEQSVGGDEVRGRLCLPTLDDLTGRHAMAEASRGPDVRRRGGGFGAWRFLPQPDVVPLAAAADAVVAAKAAVRPARGAAQGGAVGERRRRGRG